MANVGLNDLVKPKKESKVQVVEVIRHSGELLVPESMSLLQAIETLQRRAAYEEEKVCFAESFDAFPWDGANALWQVLRAKYGWASGQAVETFFGTKFPEMRTIEIGPGQTAEVPWGRLQIPGVVGFIDLGAERKSGRTVFAASVTTQRKFHLAIKELFTLVRQYLREHSIYKGQAVKMRFLDEDGNLLAMPEPRFMDASGINRDDVIFPASVEDAIDTNLFTPISRMADLKAAGIACKRGVLLAGRYGVGKTLAARVAASLAVEAGVTFLYCQRADELARAVEFATQYQPAVVFCEDIDRSLAGERSASMDDVLNVIDGIDSKQSDLMVVLTTNKIEEINPAMLRPGRLDAVIEVLEPDAPAVEKLLRLYGKDVLDKNADLKEVAAALAGNIPAVIAEVVKRSKLTAFKRTPKGTTSIKVDAQALREAAQTMQMQLELLNPKKTDNGKSTLDGVLIGHLAELEARLHAKVKAANSRLVDEVRS